MKNAVLDFEQAEPEFKYETVGEIIEIKDGEVRVLKTEENEFILEFYIDTDFSARYTNMGHMITTVEGTIKSIDGKNATVSTEDGDLMFSLYEDRAFETGCEVIVDYFKFDPESDENILINIYDKVYKLNLTVISIRRSENGVMILETKDANEMDYVVYISGKTVVNFNFSDLSEEDSITVYPESIMESYPIQVEAIMVVR